MESKVKKPRGKNKKVSERFVTKDLNDPTYTPGLFLNKVSERLDCKNDHQLATKLSMDTAQISRIRARKQSISALTVIKIMDYTDMPLSLLRFLCGVPASDEVMIIPDRRRKENKSE